DLAAQFVARALGHARDVGLRGGVLAGDFRLRVGARLVQDLAGLLLCLADDLGGLLARLADFLGDLGDGLLELGARAFGRFQSVGDLLLAFADGIQQRRPDEAYAEPDQQGESDRFADERGVDVHRYP